MKKVHTRIKRKFGLSTHKNCYYFFHPALVRRIRPKTFKTEEAANSWALNRGLKPEQYWLKSVKHDKRFQIVVMHNGQDKNKVGKQDYA